jgi:Ca2+-binding RTX toxin-like protein
MQVEKLESRQLMAITASIANGVLNIQGSDDPRGDIVQVYRFDNTRIGIRDFDFATSRFREFSVPSGGVTQLRFDGRAGNDSFQFQNGLSLPSVLVGGDGTDFLNGAQFHGNVLLGGAGNDFLNGGNANDTILGEAGDDVINGGLGTDGMYGQAGNDTVSYIGRNDRITAFLDGRAASGGINERDTISADTENLIGGNAADNLYGNNLRNVIRGGRGNDFIFGNDGDDQLFGDDDSDYLHGGNGADLLHGGNGSDQLDARDGTTLDTVIGKDSAAQINTRDLAYVDSIGLRLDSFQFIDMFR